MLQLNLNPGGWGDIYWDFVEIWHYICEFRRGAIQVRDQDLFLL